LRIGVGLRITGLVSAEALGPLVAALRMLLSGESVRKRERR
jgi:hypothetical protein